MAETHEKLSIRRLVTGDYKVNTYIVSCSVTGKAAIIDPGGEPDQILAVLKEDQLTPVFILNTHGHADHCLANGALRSALDVPVCLHSDDDIFFADPDVRMLAAQQLGLEMTERADVSLQESEPVLVGDLSIQVLHTPGHSPGSVCFHVCGNLFTGDTLFVGDVGRTDLVGGSLEVLLASIRDKILPLPPATIVRPGHDYGEMSESTLTWEKEENPYIAEFILAEDD